MTASPGPSGGAPPATATARTLLQKPPSSLYEADPDALSGEPGALLEALELAAPRGLRAWAVLYESTGIDGDAVPVSGLLLAPADGAGRAGGHPVVAWGHGTTGLADACAPSRDGVLGVDFEPLVELARAGFVVAATDYEGLGTAGIHPYLVGVSEGRAILDSIRAAARMPTAGGSTRSAIVGISQGGHAALWAAEVAPGYAPELDVAGIVAASPPMDLRAVQGAMLGREDPGEAAWLEALMVAAAWGDVYGTDVEPLLTDEALGIVRALRDECPWSIPGPSAYPFRVDPGTVPAWQALLEANSPGHEPSRAPILVIAATDDELIPRSTIAAGIDRLCGAGSAVELRWIEGGHASTLADPLGAAWAMSWSMDRLNGRPTTDGCG